MASSWPPPTKLVRCNSDRRQIHSRRACHRWSEDRARLHSANSWPYRPRSCDSDSQTRFTRSSRARCCKCTAASSCMGRARTCPSDSSHSFSETTRPENARPTWLGGCPVRRGRLVVARSLRGSFRGQREEEAATFPKCGFTPDLARVLFRNLLAGGQP